MWGIKAPEGVRVYWGARAIYKDGFVDILWDRQSIDGLSKKQRHALAVWVNTIGLAGLKAELERQSVSPRDHKDVIYRQGGYIIIGNPRGSAGYLYMGSWPEVAND